MDLKTYTAERGRAAQLARALNVSPVLISQWASGSRPIPEERGAAIEFETGFQVRAEVSCPHVRWERVPHPDWPHGKPLIDKTPADAAEKAL
jgi:DNA-binding transcriptional regulator YdaS (Cro superfamily)